MKYLQIKIGPGLEIPYLSLLVGMAALPLFFLQDAGYYFQYDRTAIAAGQFWRIITGHWTHWSFDHFLWCTISFVALGSLCERLNRKGFIIALVFSTIFIPAVGWLVDPAMEQYRGLSGICSGLFVAGCLMMIRQALAEKALSELALPALAGLLFLGKILFEFLTEQSIFVHSSMFTPVPLMHLAGGIVGLATGILTRTHIQSQNQKHITQPFSRSCQE